MTAIVGWIVIAVVFCAFSMALTLPIYRLLRRSQANARSALWGYAAAVVGSSLALWYLIPLVIYGLYGRKAP
jgi:hypothetical protein